jgi:hypothetical protein
VKYWKRFFPLKVRIVHASAFSNLVKLHEF